MQECGYPELTSFSQSGTITIDNITPNPAAGTIVVAVSSGASSPISAKLSIIDALGRTVCQQNIMLIGGQENHIPVNVGNLPSGIYAARLIGAGLASTQEFVKE